MPTFKFEHGGTVEFREPAIKERYKSIDAIGANIQWTVEEIEQLRSECKPIPMLWPDHWSDEEWEGFKDMMINGKGEMPLKRIED